MLFIYLFILGREGVDIVLLLGMVFKIQLLYMN